MSVFSPNAGSSSSSVELADEFAPQRLLFASTIIIVSGAIFYHYFRETILPYTVVVFLFGIVLGLFSTLPGFAVFQSVFKNFSELPPRMLFMVFLPVLIFEGAYGIRTHVLTRVLPIAVVFATVGLIINTLLVGAALKLVVADSLNWYAAFLLGSVLSATDPVAVVCLLKSLGVDASLTALIDAEAIMNDGTAIITYVLLFPAAVSGSWETSSAELVANVFQLMIGAIFLGLAFGVLMHRVLRACEGDDIMFAILSICFPFIIYFTADVVVDTSGVLTLFVSGTWVSRNYPSHFPGKAHSVLMVSYEFWVQALNTMLFCMVGIIVSREAVASVSLWTVFLQFYMHVAASVCRFAMLLALWPLVNLNPAFKLRWQHVVIAAHGGLKGGVATILTLVIVTSGALSKEVTALFLHVNLGVVMLSLITNATTSKKVVQWLKLQSRPRHNLMHMAIGMKRLKHHVDLALHRTSMIPTYRKAHFPRVQKLAASIQNPYEEVLIIDETDMDCFKNLLMRVAKSEIWNLRDTERLSEDATCVLTKALHSRKENTLLDVSSFFDEELKYPSWIGYFEGLSSMVGDFLHEQVVEWRFSHDLTLFESLVGLTFILDSLERLVPDIATSDEILKFGTEYIAYQRKKIDAAIDQMTVEHPTIMASVITQFAAQRVINAAAHAAHDELDAGFSQRDTAALVDAVHDVQHMIHELPVEGLEAVSAASVLPVSRLSQGCISETVLRLQRECKLASAKADEYVKLNRKDILVVIVGSAASSRSLRDLSQGTMTMDTLVVGSEYGTACHVSPNVFNDDVIALTEVVYGVLPGPVVDELMALDGRFADNVRQSGAGYVAWQACRSLMRDAMMPRYSKADAHAACLSGRLIEVGTDEGAAALRGLSKLSEDVFFLAGSDSTSTIRAETTMPFLVPRCACFHWNAGTLLYAVDFSLVKGALVEMQNQELTSSDDDDGHDGGAAHAQQRQDSSSILMPGSESMRLRRGMGDASDSGFEMAERPEAAKAGAPRALGLAYDPAECSSLIPFVTTGQLQLLLTLERLQFLAKNYASQRLSSEKRQFLEAEVTHALGQLVTVCGSLFPAEAGIYRIAIRMGEVDMASSPLGTLRAPRWYRGTGPTPEELGLVSPTRSLRSIVTAAVAKERADQQQQGAAAAVASSSFSARMPADGGGGCSDSTLQGSGAGSSAATHSSSAALHWQQLRRSVHMFRERQQMLRERHATAAATAGAGSLPMPIDRDEIRQLHNHIEEHETFLGFVSSFVSGHTSRLVSKKRAEPLLAAVTATDGKGNISHAHSRMGASSAPASSAPAALTASAVAVTRNGDLPSSVSLYQFIRTAKAFINQHCRADREASRLVVNCLGPEVVASLSSAQHAMTFWQNCAEE